MSTCHIQLLFIVATNSCHTHSPLHCYLRPPYIVATYNRHKQLPYTHTITPLILKLRYTGVIYSRHTQLPYDVTSHWYIHISCYNTFIIYNPYKIGTHSRHAQCFMWPQQVLAREWFWLRAYLLFLEDIGFSPFPSPTLRPVSTTLRLPIFKYSLTAISSTTTNISLPIYIKVFEKLRYYRCCFFVFCLGGVLHTCGATRVTPQRGETES